jgi:hypothetical protein
MLSSFMKNALLALALAVSMPSVSGCTLFCSPDEGFDGSLPLVLESQVPINSCAMAKGFEGLLAAFPQFCTVLNGMQSACGCPTPSDNPCNMCPGGGKVSSDYSDTIISKPNEEDLGDLVANVDQAFVDLFDNAQPSCNLLQAFSQSIDEGSAGCTTMTDIFAGQCGCAASAGGQDGEVTVQTDPPGQDGEVTVQTDPPVPSPTEKPVAPPTEKPVASPTGKPTEALQETTATKDKDTSGGAGGMTTTAIVSSFLVYFTFLLL